MKMPETAPIPVFRSRFTPIARLPEPYGAFISWERGESVTLKLTDGSEIYGTIVSDLLWHEKAPVIDSARGEGRWVYEMMVGGERVPVSARCLRFASQPASV